MLLRPDRCPHVTAVNSAGVTSKLKCEVPVDTQTPSANLISFGMATSSVDVCVWNRMIDGAFLLDVSGMR